VMRTDYQQLLMDRNYLLEVGEMYHRALREKETEVDRLTHELVSTRGFLEGAQTTLQESKYRLEELLEETSQGSTTSVSAESQMFTLATSPENVSGLVEEREEYLGSLMLMEKCDQDTQEDVHVPQGPPFMRGPATVAPTHTHGDSRVGGRYKGTSIWVLGLVDPAVHSGNMMVQEDTKSCMGI
jgi:hypothetical protein